MRYILKTDLPGPTYLAALYSAEEKQVLMTRRVEDACSYSEARKAEHVRRQLKQLFAIDAVVTPSSD